MISKSYIHLYVRLYLYFYFSNIINDTIEVRKKILFHFEVKKKDYLVSKTFGEKLKNEIH